MTQYEATQMEEERKISTALSTHLLSHRGVDNSTSSHLISAIAQATEFRGNALR